MICVSTGQTKLYWWPGFHRPLWLPPTLWAFSCLVDGCPVGFTVNVISPCVCLVLASDRHIKYSSGTCCNLSRHFEQMFVTLFGKLKNNRKKSVEPNLSGISRPAKPNSFVFSSKKTRLLLASFFMEMIDSYVRVQRNVVLYK